MEEPQQANSHAFTDENIVTVELLDIEEALRFDKLDITVLKQNISKTINIFYEIEQLHPKAQRSQTMMIRKLLECLGIAFGRLFEMHDQTTRQLTHKSAKALHNKNDEQLSGSDIRSKHSERQSIRTLGGCAIKEEVRGIQQPHLPEPCQKCMSNTVKPLPSFDIEQEEKWEVEDEARELLNIGPKMVSTSSFVSMIEAHMNSFKQKPSNSFDSSLQYSLSSILRFFSECEKDATQFINRKALEIAVTCQPGYEVASEIDSLRKDKATNKETAMRLLASMMERNRSHLTNILQTYQSEKEELQKSKRAECLRNRYKFSNQGVQTQEAVNTTSLKEQMQEQAVQIHSLQTERNKLMEEIAELNKIIEAEKARSRKQSEAVNGLKVQLEAHRESVKPMQEYIDSLTEDYNKLQDHLQESIEFMNEQRLEEVVEATGISPEIKDKMRSVLKGLVSRVSAKSSIIAKKRKPFRFRIGLLKTIESQNLSESFAKELSQIKSKRTLKSQCRQTDEPLEESEESVIDVNEVCQKAEQELSERPIKDAIPVSIITPKRASKRASKHTQRTTVTLLNNPIQYIGAGLLAPPPPTHHDPIEIAVDSDPTIGSKQLQPLISNVVRNSRAKETPVNQCAVPRQSNDKISVATQYFIETCEMTPSAMASINELAVPLISLANRPYVSLRASLENTERLLLKITGNVIESKFATDNSTPIVTEETSRSVIYLIDAAVQVDREFSTQKVEASTQTVSTSERKILPTVQHTVRQASIVKFRGVDPHRRHQSSFGNNAHPSKLPSLNTSVEEVQRRQPNKSILTSTQHTHSTIGQFSRTEANEQIPEQKRQSKNRLVIQKRHLNSSLHTEDEKMLNITRISVLDTLPSEHLESIKEIRSEVMRIGLHEKPVNAQSLEKETVTKATKLTQEHTVLEHLKESTFKHFSKQREFEDSVSQLMRSLDIQPPSQPITARKDFRRFLQEQQQLHAKHCGGGMCQHLTRFLQIMRNLVSRYNGRRTLTMPLQKIGKILSNKEREG